MSKTGMNIYLTPEGPYFPVAVPAVKHSNRITKLSKKGEGTMKKMSNNKANLAKEEAVEEQKEGKTKVGRASELKEGHKPSKKMPFKKGKK